MEGEKGVADEIWVWISFILVKANFNQRTPSHQRNITAALLLLSVQRLCFEETQRWWQ